MRVNNLVKIVKPHRRDENAERGVAFREVEVPDEGRVTQLREYTAWQKEWRQANRDSIRSYVFLIRQPLFEQLGMLVSETKASINAVITAALESLFFSIDSHRKKLFAMALAARYLPDFAGLLGYLGGGAYMELLDKRRLCDQS